MILGGSTNAVLHLIAVAHSVGIKLTIDDFQSVSDRIPFLADLKPSGKYVMEHVFKIGGIPCKSHENCLCIICTDFILSLSRPQVLVAKQVDRRQHYDRHRQDHG